MDKRLTKVFFSKNFALNANEKKFLADKIDQMRWLGIITPTNSNIPPVVNSAVDFSLVNVFCVSLLGSKLEQDGEKAGQLLQKYLPDPALVVAENDLEIQWCAADKRINQADSSKRTIETFYATNPISKLYKRDTEKGFFKALAFDQLDKSNLQNTYRSYISAITQYQTALVTGSYTVRNAARTAEDQVRLEQIERLEQELVSLKSAIKKESQMNNQVQMNMTIHQKKKQIEDLKTALKNN